MSAKAADIPIESWLLAIWQRLGAGRRESQATAILTLMQVGTPASDSDRPLFLGRAEG